LLKCADERNVCETKAYKVYGKMYQNHVDESYAVELVVGRHPEFPGSTGGKPPEYVQHRRSTYCQCRTETAKTAAMMTSLVSLFISVPLERGALRQLHKNSSPDFLCLRRRRNWTLRRVLNQVSKMSFQFRVPRYACFFSGNSFRKLLPARLH